MSIDYQDIYEQLYDRAATDSAGATLRALLGNASSVFPRKGLRNLNGKVLPFLVWAPGAVSGQSNTMRDLNASWFVYCGPGKGPKVLHEIATALDDLYGSLAPFAIAYGRLQVTFIGQPFVDSALDGLEGVEVRIGYRRLG